MCTYSTVNVWHIHLCWVQVSVLHEELERARERIAQLEEENRGNYPGMYVPMYVCMYVCMYIGGISCSVSSDRQAMFVPTVYVYICMYTAH